MPSLELYYFLLLVLVLLLTLWFFFRTLRLFKHKRLWAGCRNSTYFLVFLLFLTSVGLVGSNILTYHRLTHETPVASIQVKQLQTQRYKIEFLHLQNCLRQSFVIEGDEWQLDARIIKWHSWANILGLDAVFQLDRISGRYRDIEQQRQHRPTVFMLEAQPEYDLWALKKKYQWLPWLDAKYGQSVYLTMKDEQEYQVFMSQSGLIARNNQSEVVASHCPVTLR